MTDANEPPMIAEMRLRSEMAEEFASAAPDGWSRIEHSISSVGSVTDTSTAVTLTNGETALLDPPRAVVLARRELRRAMYEPERGTWFSMELVVTREGTAETTYNYEGEPWSHTPIGPQRWLADQKKFPRSPENRPDWLRAKLADAGYEDDTATSSPSDDELTRAAQFAERIGAPAGLSLLSEGRGEVFALFDGEVGFAVVPVEGGFELERSSRSELSPVAFATRLDDALRMFAVVITPRFKRGVGREDLPSGFRYEAEPTGVTISWKDRNAQESVVRVWGLSLGDAVAVRVALWADKDLDDIADEVLASR
ncbi:acetate and sugar kinases/Hsc70/actin family protein [Microbacterium halophytorum]|uniref:hypothetical protein n=1 Tax=Microbacterium halophytorum TaxID=2067568 RepID=UPI000CFBE08A|nr:hypothetical protein [Microbacterium halophytorum]